MDGIDTNVDLDGRIAVVTGGNDEGIGREVAINLAMAGAKVYMRDSKNVSSTESSINKELQGRQINYPLASPNLLPREMKMNWKARTSNFRTGCTQSLPMS